MTIPLIHVDASSSDGRWAKAPASYWSGARALVSAFNRQGEAVVGAAPWWAFTRSVGALHTLLGSHFSAEVAELAAGIDGAPSDIVTANAAYDLAHVGCSTFAVQTRTGPLHARNLDWSFPGGLLRKHVVVEHVTGGAAGDAVTVTWPGLFGALTGMAPGRFSVSVNYVRHAEESVTRALARRAVAGFWPCTWVVRQVLETAPDFAAAVRFLKRVPLLAPVLFTVAGVEDDERVVLERSAEGCAVRRGNNGAPVFVTNHYVSKAMAGNNGDLSGFDTGERFASLGEVLARGDGATSGSALQVLAGEELLRSDTQHQVVMSARAGTLTVKVPGGDSRTISV